VFVRRFLLRPGLLDSLGQQPGVEVKADGRNVTMLARTQ
jgi:hypothetical protein